MRYHKVIGIDLGMTYSAVSVWDFEKKEAVVIQSAVGENTLPSVVGLDDDKKVVVGRLAQQRLLFDPKNSIIEIKREMGVYSRNPDPQRQDPGEPKRVRFREREYLPQEISAFILAELKRQAEKFLGEEVHDAVITVPAYFQELQRSATEDAATIARLNVKQLLDEPTAAAVYFGKNEYDSGRHIYAVYDLGSGTFDGSIIEFGGGNVRVLGTGGDPRLGGDNFDDRITSWALAEIKKKHGVDLQHNDMVKARIKQVAELRKRELSAANSAAIDLPFLTAQLSVKLPITRAIFNELIEDLLQKSLRCVDEAIESAQNTRGVRKEDIEQVLLLGGSSRIPRVRALVAEYFGHLEEKDLRSDNNPDEVISRGAALVARKYNPSNAFVCKEINLVASGIPRVRTLLAEYFGRLEEKDLRSNDNPDEVNSRGAALVARKHDPSDAFVSKDIDLVANGGIMQADCEDAASIVLQDVTSHTLGVMVNGRDFRKIIPKETPLPALVTLGGFVNPGPSQVFDVFIYQGEDPLVFNNVQIGKLSIPLPEPRERGYWRFEITFQLDNAGLLNVFVERLNDNHLFRLRVVPATRFESAQREENSTHLSEVLASDVGENHAKLDRMSDLFISHVEEDGPVALEIARGLNAAGYTTWCYEEDSNPGPSYMVQIVEAIEACQAVLIIISPESLGSDQVTKEIEYSHDVQKPFVPILKGISHVEFQNRKVSWRLAVGAALSIPIPPGGVAAILPRIIRGLQGLKVKPAKREPVEARPFAQEKAEVQRENTETLRQAKEKATPEREARESADSERRSEAQPVAGAVRDNPKDGLKYVWIPSGTFMMGCSPGDSECRDDEKPSHQVTISRGFWLGQTEVTVGAYKRFADATRKAMPQAPDFNPDWDNERMPMVNVSWAEAKAYCAWARGRLPTEAEWEYAARAGSTSARYGLLDEVAWYESNSGSHAHPVGQKRANGFGFYDMLGNVEEWVNDGFDENYYKNSPSQNPSGPVRAEYRVRRGGSWHLGPRFVRVSYRYKGNPGSRKGDIGFRCGGEVFTL